MSLSPAAYIRSLSAAAVASVVLLAAACSGADLSSQPAGETAALETPTVVVKERYALRQPLDFTITLTTTSVGGTFGRLQKQHTCEQGDTSPHVAWAAVPEGTESLALVVEDPASDVHGLSVDVLWAHWVVYAIPPEATELEPGQAAGDVLTNGAKQGTNDYGNVQYNGPCPVPTLGFFNRRGSPGSSRTITAEERLYYFRLYALDVQVDPASGADRDTLMEAIDGHVLAAAEIGISYKSTERVTCRSQDAVLCVETLVR